MGIGDGSKWSLLSRLKRAINKVKILLNLDLNRWRLASMIGQNSSNKFRFSFNDRPGLRACTDFNTESVHSSDSSPSVGGLRRTISYPSDHDDIDKRAELFIQNFRRQLQIERQVSLELKYLQHGNSFKILSP